MKFKIGDSVAVKSGVTDPDFGFDISGWQGRIQEVDSTGTVFIRWDSLTLNQMGLDLTRDGLRDVPGRLHQKVLDIWKKACYV